MENLHIETDLEYITELRNDALENFNDHVKMNSTKETLQNRFDVIIRFNKQIKLLEDCLVIYRTIE
jgi:hypothetical protein